MAAGYELDYRFSIADKGKIFSSPWRPYWLRRPPSLLSIEYRELFPLGQSGRSVKLASHLHIVSRSSMVEL
jgi:hypothetical protein